MGKLNICKYCNKTVESQRIEHVKQDHPDKWTLNPSTDKKEHFTRKTRPKYQSRARRLDNALKAIDEDVNILRGVADELEVIVESGLESDNDIQAKEGDIQKAFEVVRNLEVNTSEIEELYDEIDQWASGMEGTGLENTQKYSDLDECRSQLD